MRIITGKAKGRRLKTLEGNDVRPTTDRVKEALFSSIQFDVEGRRVLDLFSGSGQLGLEAISRGAESAVFVDINPDSYSVTLQNIKALGFEDCAKAHRKDFFSFLASNTEKFDIAFLDPPYSKGLLLKAANAVASAMSEYGIIVCEHPLSEAMPDTVGDGFVADKRLKSGKIAITIYRKQG